MDVDQEINAVMALHDSAPAEAAVRLWALLEHGVETRFQARASWLANHVIGEHFKRWDDALRFQRRLLTDDAPPPLAVLRNGAVAASLAGDPAQAHYLEHRMQRDGVSAALAGAAVRVATAAHALPGGRAEHCAASLLTALDQLDPLPPAGPADTLLAAGFNNAVSALLDAEGGPPFAHATVRDAIRRGAETSRALWARAGTPLNAARGDYLCARAHRALGRHTDALAAAERGAGLLGDGHAEIDRAFLLVEIAHARHGLGEPEAGARAFEQAEAIAAGWDDASLRGMYDAQAAALRAARRA